MGNYYNRYRPTLNFGGMSLTPAVKMLLIVNFVLWIIPVLTGFDISGRTHTYLRPIEIVHPPGIAQSHPEIVNIPWGYVWQPFTYMFFHDIHGLSHILFNMLALWMFGTAIEGSWGTRTFAKYYVYCGLAAGVSVILAATAAFLVSGSVSGLDAPTIGASGAIFGLIIAFGMLFPDSPILVFFVFPMPAKYFAVLMGFIEFYMQWTQPGSRVNHLAHLGGMLFGFLYIKFWMQRQRRPKLRSYVPFSEDEPRSPATTWNVGWKEKYRQWKIKRARKKFEVYMKKHNGGQGPRLQ